MRDHVDGETPRRGRARSAIAARFARFAECPTQWRSRGSVTVAFGRSSRSLLFVAPGQASVATGFQDPTDPPYTEIGRIIAAGIPVLKETRILGVVCVLLAATPLSAQGKDASCSAFAGTWYGAFRVLTDDGRSTRDNAVIVLSGDCSNVTGSAGSAIDRQMPISAVQLVGGVAGR